MKIGSTAMLAQHLRIPYSEMRAYLDGEAMPPEDVLLRTVDTILEELPAIRGEFPPEVWHSLRLPPT